VIFQSSPLSQLTLCPRCYIFWCEACIQHCITFDQQTSSLLEPETDTLQQTRNIGLAARQARTFLEFCVDREPLKTFDVCHVERQQCEDFVVE